MTDQSEIGRAELQIRSALQERDPMAAMIDAYASLTEEEKFAFAAALIGRVVISSRRLSGGLPGEASRS
jgi:hypothetical protein